MRRYLPFMIIAFGVVTAGVILLIPTKKVTSTVNNVAKCTGTSDFTCYSNYYAAKTRTSDPVTALNDLKKLGETDTYAKAQCHQLAHVIGHEGYSKYQSLSAAFTKGDSYCWSGYYHGVTESAVGAIGVDKIKQQANTLCADLAAKQKYSFDHFNCVHGLGHGFMTVDNFKLFDALKSCDVLSDSWEQDSCYGGVFMENVMVAVRGDGTSQYLKPDQLMYPCTAVGTRYKEQCYLMQTSYALQQTSYDFTKVAADCQSLADTDFIPTCYQSLGRDASGSTNSDIAKTKTNCAAATSDVGTLNCMLGAVRDIISYFHSDVQAKQFCAEYPADLATACTQETSTYYATFIPPRET